MKTKTRIHKVQIEGGFEKSSHAYEGDMSEHHIALLKKHSKITTMSQFDYDYVGLKDHGQLGDLLGNRSSEELTTLLPYTKWGTVSITIQDDALLELITHKIKHTVIETTTLEVEVSTENDSAEIFFNKTMDIMTRYQEQLERMSKNTYNEKVKVHTGGIALAEYNQTMVKYDCCTDELQQHLQEGWRILSVCVQPDQRRPDYILGKVVPENTVTEAALRY
jgi:hypothetical protein